MANTDNSLNIHMSIRKYLWENVYTPFNIPVVAHTTKTEDQLTYNKYVYFFASIREGPMGDPQIYTDVTFHVKAKEDIDFDGKWSLMFLDKIVRLVREADRRDSDDGSFGLFDYFALIEDLELQMFYETGDIDHIDDYLRMTPDRISSFWLYKWSRSVLDRVNHYYDASCNLTLLHYAQDIIRI